jgi:hypothetical protein
MAKRPLATLAAVLAVVLLLQCCAALADIAGALANLQRLRFKLGGVRGFSLAGISLAGKAGLTDFNVEDGVRLFQAFNSRKLPADFILDVLAVNPNDGTGGTTKTTATLSGLESRLLIDGQPTVYVDIAGPVEIPGTGQAATISLRLGLDLREFFGSHGYDRLIELALAIGGRQGGASRLSLDALPTVTTPLGEIRYPGRITIIDKEFR